MFCIIPRLNFGDISPNYWENIVLIFPVSFFSDLDLDKRKEKKLVWLLADVDISITSWKKKHLERAQFEWKLLKKEKNIQSSVFQYISL